MKFPHPPDREFTEIIIQKLPILDAKYYLVARIIIICKLCQLIEESEENWTSFSKEKKGILNTMKTLLFFIKWKGIILCTLGNTFLKMWMSIVALFVCLIKVIGNYVSRKWNTYHYTYTLSCHSDIINKVNFQITKGFLNKCYSPGNMIQFLFRTRNYYTCQI